MQRILFVAESVTLAQVVRLAYLASGLDSRLYEVHFACSDFPDLVFRGTGFERHRLVTLEARLVDKALRSGTRLYEKQTLREYLDAELRLLERVKPALVVGDFRLTLSTSAELAGVPSATLINAYWSPFARREAFPVPDHPIIGWLGEARTKKYFPQALPHVFRHFAEPLNAVRRERKLAPVGSLLEALTHGTFTLYPDDPETTPVDRAPPGHRFLGPISWQPEVPTESFEVPGDPRPLVYATLGSSGRIELLSLVLEALSTLPVRVVLATAGRADPGRLPDNVVAKSFVRGGDVAREARFVVPNGGSTTGYQALSQGTPVVGIPSNLDQYLASQAIVRAGAGLEVKARSADGASLRAAFVRALEDEALQRGAAVMARRFRAWNARGAFSAFLSAALSVRNDAPARTDFTAAGSARRR